MRDFCRLRRSVACILFPELVAIEGRIAQLEAYVSFIESAAHESLDRAASCEAMIFECFQDPANWR